MEVQRNCTLKYKPLRVAVTGNLPWSANTKMLQENMEYEKTAKTRCQ